MLSVKNISKKYPSVTALNNVSLHIPQGVCFGLVGPNGAGKSTFIKIIASVIHDFDGDIHYSGQKPRIGYVSQEISLEDTVSAVDNLSFFGKLYGLRGKKLKRRIDEVLDDTGLKERKKDKVKTFSGGMKRRLNIGCAILHEPDLIIMDEPTVGIDPQSRLHIFQMIERFKKEGRTILYASHYMEEIERLCDLAAFIDKGKIVENGPVEELLKKYAVPSVFVKGENCLPDDIGQYGKVTERNGGYFITTNAPLEVMEKIIVHSKRHNSQIEQLELVKTRLEDVFFSLTGSQLRD